MSPSPAKSSLLFELFQQLRRRRFPLGPDDYLAMQLALKAGFGWESRESLRNLCCSLWAKSRRDEEVIHSLFDDMHILQDWELPALDTDDEENATNTPAGITREKKEKEKEQKPDETEPPVTRPQTSLPPVNLSGVKLAERSFVFVPQFPLTNREVAQVWRRLRRPSREGPPIELDITATLNRRTSHGVVAGIVLRPRRRNKMRLVLLVDQQGSMTPLHRLCQEVCEAIQQMGRLEQVATFYFHDVPATGADISLLNELADEPFPNLDGILSQINLLTDGEVCLDPELLKPVPLKKVLDDYARGAAVVIISDAGAARGNYDLFRLLDTVAFLKGLHHYTTNYVWLNPLPKRYWQHNTASQIGRYVPMFQLDIPGMHQAVNVLRGQPYPVERAV